MNIDGIDYIGTIIAGFKEIESILQQMADLSGLKTVSTQNLLQAVFNGYIHPQTCFKREVVSFALHQPAEEGVLSEEEPEFDEQV